MTLTDKLVHLGILPANLTLKEKIYYGIAQLNACALPIAMLTMLSPDPEISRAALYVSLGNAASTVVSIALLQRSVNKRNGPGYMSVNYTPHIRLFPEGNGQ